MACCSSNREDNDNVDSSTEPFEIGTWNSEADNVVGQLNDINVEVFNHSDLTTSQYYMDDTILLEFPKFSKGFKTSDFREFVRKYIGEENVEKLEQQKHPNIWIMVLKNKEIRENLLRIWKTKIKNKTCWINPYHAYEIRGFLHWLPHFISDDDVKRQLSQYGDVLFLENEVHDYWNGGIKSEVKYFGLRLKDGMVKDDMPHFLKFSGYITLVIIRGRKPACFHCREFGHSKNDCLKYKEKLQGYCKNPEAKKPRTKPRGRRHRPESVVKLYSEESKPQNETNSNLSRPTSAQKEKSLVKSNLNKSKKKEVLAILRSLKEWEKEIIGMVEQILNTEENSWLNLIPTEQTVIEAKEDYTKFLVGINKARDDMKQYAIEIIEKSLINLKNIVAKYFGLDSNETLDKLISNLETKRREKLRPEEVKLIEDQLLNYI